jgi:hypothetical protein
MMFLVGQTNPVLIRMRFGRTGTLQWIAAFMRQQDRVIGCPAG